jgi:hypothetical protein
MLMHPSEHGIVEGLRVTAPHQLRELGERVRAEDGDERSEHEKYAERRSERVSVPVCDAKTPIQKIPRQAESSSVFVSAFGGNGHRLILLVGANVGCSTVSVVATPTMQGASL